MKVIYKESFRSSALLVGIHFAMLDVTGGPRFVSPCTPGLGATVNVEDLPVIVYFPGADGTGLAASRQFPSLAKSFEVQALTIPIEDTTSFEDLVDFVEVMQTQASRLLSIEIRALVYLFPSSVLTSCIFFFTGLLSNNSSSPCKRTTSVYFRGVVWCSPGACIGT